MAVGADSHGVGGDGTVAQHREGTPPLGCEQVADGQPDQDQHRQAEPVETLGLERLQEAEQLLTNPEVGVEREG